MRNKHYKNKSIRISEETWQKLQEARKKESWNIFMVKLLKQNDTRKITTKV